MERKSLGSYFLFFITIMAANIFVMMIVAALITMFGYGEYITWQEKENGFGFINRTNSKYYFQPDQRDELVQLICEELDIATKTLSYKDWAEKNNVKDIPVAQNPQTAV